MPIYEYKCSACNHSFEQLQKMTDKPLRTCPECGKNQLTKLISNTSFQLKGTGWYVTDFKNNKKEEPKKNTEIKTETKTETKNKAKKDDSKQ